MQQQKKQRIAQILLSVGLAMLLLPLFSFAQTCTGGLSGSSLQDCTGTDVSPCHKCDVNDMQFEIRAPDDVATSGWQTMTYSTGSGTCSAGCADETWTRSHGYTYCPQEGAYDIRTRASAQNQTSYAWETSDWNLSVYSVTWDSLQDWCTCKTGSSANWFGTVSGGSNGQCCGDDGANDDFYYHTADPTTATSLDCTRCLDGTKAGPTTVYGNGYTSGTTCYYGDITCTAASAANGATCTLNTGGQCIADVGCLNSPTSLAISNKAITSISLSWTDNSTIEDGFKIERSPDGSSWTEIGTVGANTTAYDSNNLNCNTRYYYQVRAYRSTTNSGYTSTVNAFTLATVPSSVNVAADSSTQVTVSWSECANNSPENWVDETTGNPGGSDSVSWQTANSFVDSGLNANTQYCYRVKARNGDANETAYASQVCKYSLPANPVPASSSHTAGQWSNDSTVDFTCSGAASTYYYKWDQVSNSTVSSADTSWNGSQITKTATSNGDWYLHVIAVNPDGAYNSGGTQHMGPFRIDTSVPDVIATYDEGIWSYDLVLEFTSTPNDALSGISDCNMEIRRDSTSGTIIFSGSAGSDGDYAFSGQNNVTYYARTKCVDTAGNWAAFGSFSDGVTIDVAIISTDQTNILRTYTVQPSAETSSDNQRLYDLAAGLPAQTYTSSGDLNLGIGFTTIVGIPRAPSSLSVTADANSLAISWDANQNPSGIDYNIINTNTSQSLGTTTSTSTNIPSLQCNTQYCIKIQSMDWAANGQTSTLCKYTWATMPADLNIVADSAVQVTLAWNGCPNSSPQYWIDETTGNSGGSDSTSWQTSTTYVDTGLSYYMQYCYRVKSRNGDNSETAYSGQVCVTTPCRPPPTGDWIVDRSCELFGSHTAPANVRITNNATLTIDAAATLDVSMADYNIVVAYGSGIYIEQGGKIT